ncbi:hypothetical protein [Fredinandcohnia quinoae]|uniref:DinB-like domain-containing protein n=1 Tax=Fredinandcohnia quinoae TaxID=2918902 RepID=A0AAW5E5I3_9BACI|nr:hypothetical protein [Fredinandcohnia sp. SECRCQ15]MCH1625317.1 hypothetical protein [Fredinandcohnia sp. SECRCQ15]
MNDMLKKSFKVLLKETFDGPGGNGSWYTESKPGSGIFGTLERVSAEEASIPVQGTTLAAHVDHTRYYLWMVNTYMKGEKPDLDWSESWKISSVDEDTWSRFKANLQNEYTTLLENIHSLTSLDEQTSYGILGSLAHSAYHLGAIRQMTKTVKAPTQS